MPDCCCCKYSKDGEPAQGTSFILEGEHKGTMVNIACLTSFSPCGWAPLSSWAIRPLENQSMLLSAAAVACSFECPG